MIAALKPYPVYKHSGIEWLGKVPEHWEVKRGKALFRCVNVRSSTGEETLLTVSSERGVVPRSSATVTMFKAESYVGYKLCWPGDLVINSLWAWGRGLGVSRHHGIISSAYGVYRLRPPYTEYFAYVHALVRSTPFNWELHVRSKGIWISRLQLTDEAFLGAPVPLPPPPEQAAIVRFLDHADRRIRRYIRAQQKLIALLEEQKQAIIHQAVTGQIDVRTGQPYPVYMPSGVEWLGDVPEHWEVKKLRQCGTVAGGVTPSMENRRFWDGAIPWITPKDMKREAICDSSMRVAEAAIHETSLRLIDPPAVLMVVRGMILARRVPIAWITGPVTINQDMKALIPVPGINPEFMARVLASAQDAFVPLIDEAGHGTRRLPTERWRDLAIAIPPRDEQEAIVDSLKISTHITVATIDRTYREIAFLREYRTRLTADVVTGKLDVREAAARLPDEVEELEPLDEADALIGGEEEPAAALATAP